MGFAHERVGWGKAVPARSAGFRPGGTGTVSGRGDPQRSGSGSRQGGDLVLKKALRLVVTFSLLSAGYLGYCRGFAAVQQRLGGPTSVPRIPYNPSPSRTARETAAMARQSASPL